MACLINISIRSISKQFIKNVFLCDLISFHLNEMFKGYILLRTRITIVPIPHILARYRRLQAWIIYLTNIAHLKILKTMILQKIRLLITNINSRDKNWLNLCLKKKNLNIFLTSLKKTLCISSLWYIYNIYMIIKLCKVMRG